MKTLKIKGALFTIVLIFASFLGGCGNNKEVTTDESNEKDTLTVFTTIFPLEDFTKKIGGERVEVKSVYPPNVDAHSFEPTTKTMTQIADADLFLYSGAGIEGFADKAVKSLKNAKVKIVKAAEGIELIESNHQHKHVDEDGHGHDDGAAHEEEHSHDDGDAHDEDGHHHGDHDPHVWLDPIRSIELAENIKNALVEQMPNHKDEFEKNFEKLKGDLEVLDSKFADTVNSAKTKYILVSHAAYGYWQNRYGIEQISISGLSPTQEPSQKGLQNIIEESKKHDIHYVIFEQNLSAKVAEIIQKEIGAGSLTLHNLEAVTDENIKNKEDYFSIMEKNLETIKTALN
ncbi:zinc ABC transporter substrate-binding protein [Bacillus sp. FJAT-29790]|uniref:metal ABC transporter solute-binding protein, Zn/Mn family n=1 Tax=Bacillus sp. FJAT-29790 TaxID=1895002 RepID=UPI001C2310D9|nr:zinc ABC transporter substrate-binding protein [Bacillus sp. FJAT-29790]MBU8878579.1 zinc ABC transporter substrate-binding protein [Bacillus sp. FJAT-29790]